MRNGNTKSVCELCGQATSHNKAFCDQHWKQLSNNTRAKVLDAYKSPKYQKAVRLATRELREMTS